MSTVVRPATSQESAEVARLAARTFALACPPSALPADISAFVAAHLTESNFAGYIADPQRYVAVAVAEESIVGYAMVILAPPADDIALQLTAAAVELSKIYVDPSHHGGGAAGALVDDAVVRVRAEGWAGLWLGTNQANRRAQRFYEKHGFRRVGTKRFRLGSQWEDDFVFELVLTER